MPPLILASTSRYRAELLGRLRVPFDVRSPHVDETALPQEAPAALARRLALAKANAVAAKLDDGLVIGSDQVAHCRGRILGKPGGFAAAQEQLRHMRGATTEFITAVALVNARTGTAQVELVPTRVTLRDLGNAEIDAYLRADEPYDCAGSARSEGLGVALMEHMAGDDPTALVGLPLIALCRMLRAEGVDLLVAR